MPSHWWWMRAGLPISASSEDTQTIQAALDALALTGGTVTLAAGTFHLTAPLVLQTTANRGLRLVGAGINATTLVQDTAGQDVLACGATGVYAGVNLEVADLTLSGGRYGLNLNNALFGLFARVRVTGATVGIYLQGQNESHTFRQLQIEDCTLHGIYGAVVNGGPGLVLDLPEIQKCRFEQIRIAGTVGGAAMVITTGLLGTQQVSGHNAIVQLLLESNRQNGLELYYAMNTWIDGMTTEEALSATNTYTSLVIGSQSTVYATHLLLSEVAVNKPKYHVEVRSGHGSIGQSVLVNATTADIHVSDNLTLVDSFITDANHLTFLNQTARNVSSVRDLRDSAGQFIAWAA